MTWMMWGPILGNLDMLELDGGGNHPKAGHTVHNQYLILLGF